jgi:nucleoside-diphosphate-sugar epimerase
MAFAAAAARGGVISVEGSANTFDFTHVADVVDGLWLMTQATMQGERLPPVQFVSGQATTLGELAQIAASQALAATRVDEAPPRDFDVTAFVGDPARAKALLGWSVQTGLRDGMSGLIASLAGTRTS